MKKINVTLGLLLMVAGTAFAEGRGLDVPNADAKELYGLLRSSGIREIPTHLGESIGADSVKCILSTSAPAAAFAPNCVLTLNSGFSESHFRMPAQNFQRFVEILRNTGVEPEQVDNQEVLQAGSIGCNTSFATGTLCRITTL